MASELETKPILRGFVLPTRRWKWRLAKLAVAGLGIGLVVVSTVGLCIWVSNDLHTTSADTLATWVAALVLVVTALVAFARKGRHAGWFHPLSLPFATLAVMSLGAVLWVHFTHEAIGLLYDAGNQPAVTSTLAVGVSIVACEALALVVLGYIVGVGAAFVLSKQAKPAAADGRWPMFRYGDMRRGGFLLLATGAVAQVAVAVIERGTTYGANQLQYGLASVLAPGAATALLVGLILVTLTGSHTVKPRYLRKLLRDREWVALSLYMLAVVVTGERGLLINPFVYLAWVYSTQVRVIAIKWIVAGVVLALIGGSAISHYRSEGGLSPGSPSTIIGNAVGDVSSPAWLTQQTVIHVPSTTGYTHGSTYLAAVEAQLPGPLARAVGAPTRTASAVFRNIIGFSNPNQGFAESLPSEAYLNFGLPGCAGVGLFLGALMGWAWRKHRATAVRARDLLYPVLLAGLIGGFRSDALTQIKEVLYPMLIVWFLMGLYRLRSQTIGRLLKEKNQTRLDRTRVGLETSEPSHSA
jgi:hypothetical protein